MSTLTINTAYLARHRVQGFPWQFWVLMAGTTISKTGNFVVPFLSYYLVHELRYSVAVAGVLTALFGGGWVVGQLVGGWSADRLGRRRTIIVSSIGTALVYIGLGFSTRVEIIAVCALLSGVLFDMPRPAVTALITDMAPPALRVRGMSYYFFVVNVTAAVAGTVGGLLASHDFTLLFLVNAALCPVLAITMWFVRDESARAGESVKAPRGYRVAFTDPSLMWFSFASLLVFTLYMQTLSTLPVAMNADGLGPAAFGLVSAVDALLVVAIQPLTQKWLERRRPLTVCVCGVVVLSAGMGLNAFAGSAMDYVFITAVWVPGEIAFMVGASAIIAGIAPEYARGRYYGVWGLTLSGGGLLAPIMGSFALDLGGKYGLWGSCAAVGLAAAAILGKLAPILRKRNAELA
ncbi:MFS transporter [Microtetraspora sp. NBRC 13810]|uniref:MFS transporter n=1 Tax=Microtetraspora sp. NBRC 13810 TaxID=3030990 RepID=UPI0025573B80|nr:MFS transporter [Microtetraspora sp. NBRC 13810]GLW10231.1 MFS transporter [Microtetraspora sp. NBRC 13810]